MHKAPINANLGAESVELITCGSPCEHLTKRGRNIEANGESIRDTLLDLANYATATVMEREGEQ